MRPDEGLAVGSVSDGPGLGTAAAVTELPAQFFDELVASLDAPGEANLALAAAAVRLPDSVVRE